MLRLAEGRVGGAKETSKAQPAYFVPTLDLPSQAPENAYSHEESVRRVNILVGEAVLQTLILVVMKRLGASGAEITHAADCKSRIVRSLSKHGFKKWSNLTSEAESILRFRRCSNSTAAGSKNMHKDDPQSPLGPSIPSSHSTATQSAVHVSLHRTGSVEVTLSRATEDAKSSNHFLPENKTNSKDPTAILPTSSPSPPMATENQRLMAALSESRAEIKRLTLDRAKLIEGLDRAQPHPPQQCKKRIGRWPMEAKQTRWCAAPHILLTPRSDASADGGPKWWWGYHQTTCPND